MEKYYTVEILKNGKIKQQKTNPPSWLNQNYISANVLLGTCCEEKDLEKTKLKLIKKCISESKREVDIAVKKHEKLIKLLSCQH